MWTSCLLKSNLYRFKIIPFPRFLIGILRRPSWTLVVMYKTHKLLHLRWHCIRLIHFAFGTALKFGNGCVWIKLRTHFGWLLVNFVYSRTDLSNSGLLSYFYNQVSDTEWCEAELLKDVLSTRDDESDGSGLELSHLNQSCAPPPPRRRRRHFADAAAAGRNWSARRRRRPHVGVAPAPFSWRVHVVLYTSYTDVARFL